MPRKSSLSKAYQKPKKRQRKRSSSFPQRPKPDTKLESLRLFRSGKTIVEIAAIRDLKPTTIENHLAYHVLDGSVGIEELVVKEKIPLIIKTIRQYSREKLSFLKAKIGDKIGYGEIKAVINYLESKRT